MPTRRKFIEVTAGLCVAAGTSPLFRTQAIAAETAKAMGPLIDCHTHFYDPTRSQGVPWPGKDDGKLYRRVLPEDYKRLTAPYGVTGTVVVEASHWVEDNQWVLDFAERDSFVLGLVGNLPVGTPEFQDHLARFAKNPRFLGLRVSSGPLAKGLANADYLADIKRLAAAGRALDVNGGPELLPLVAELAKKLPELRIVINHCANLPNPGPRKRGETYTVPAAWKSGMLAAAQCPNVFCKVSALVESASVNRQPAPRDLEHYLPLLDHLLLAFGDDRLIYGSNWPVCEYAADYATIQGIALQFFGRNAERLRKFSHINAQAAYRWPTSK